MALNDFSRPALEVEDAAKDVLNSKVDELKLRLVRGLSTLLATFLSTLVLVLLFIVAFAFLGIALAQWIGTFFAVPAIGYLIVGGVFVISAFIVLFVKTKLFVNKFIKKFISIFFPDENE